MGLLPIEAPLGEAIHHFSMGSGANEAQNAALCG